ncbi:hypothetical protein FQZ97_1024270 [compost metagenome]
MEIIHRLIPQLIPFTPLHLSPFRRQPLESLGSIGERSVISAMNEIRIQMRQPHVAMMTPRNHQPMLIRLLIKLRIHISRTIIIHGSTNQRLGMHLSQLSLQRNR